MHNAECRMHNFGSPADLDYIVIDNLQSVIKKQKNRVGGPLGFFV
jgi:hypothetical protein